MPSPSPLLESDRGARLTREALAEDLRDRVFRPGSAPRRIGAEIETLPVVADTGRMAPILSADSPATLPVLRRCAVEFGWSEGDHAGVPTFHTPEGTLVSFEPGGQIELSSAPYTTIGELARGLRQTLAHIRKAAEADGIRLLDVGMHPTAPVEETPLQTPVERYQRMDRYLSRIGPAGARMMRLTAACQVNVDWGEEPARVMRVLNAAAPLLTAIFANSPRRAGAAEGAASHRALAWRELDGARTGLHGAGSVEEYLHFALGAGAVLLGAPREEPLPFGEWVRRGEATLGDWRSHLSTLFPEVRPKGYAEVRCIDAVDPDWLEAPLVLVAALTQPAALAEAEDLLGAPRPEALDAAARLGLGDAQMLRGARGLWDLALDVARKNDLSDPASIEVARDFADRFTRRGLAPADSINL